MILAHFASFPAFLDERAEKKEDQIEKQCWPCGHQKESKRPDPSMKMALEDRVAGWVRGIRDDCKAPSCDDSCKDGVFERISPIRHESAQIGDRCIVVESGQKDCNPHDRYGFKAV